MRKGVTPLIASVFLIVIVVVVASIITTWMTTLVSDTQKKVSERTSEGVECSNADITIDDVFVSSGSANAIVRNSGFVDNMTLPQAQLFNNMGGNFSANNLPLQNFDRGEIQTVLFQNVAINCPTFSRVIITTSCGSVTAEFKGSPTCV